MSRQAENSRARAAGMARATYGRNTRWRSTRGILADHERETAQEAIAEARESRQNRYCQCANATQYHKVVQHDGRVEYTCMRCGSVKS